MLLCDGCCKNATTAFRITTGDTEQAKYALCWDCVEAVMKDVMFRIDQRCPKLREACPSLTPDQARQVEAYIARKAMEGKP